MDTHAALFLDRDGVIIENRSDYVRSWQDVAFCPGSLAALAEIARSPYQIVMVTNQSAVGRGIISLPDAEQLNRRILGVIEESGGRIDAVYMCPHAPWEGCDCRKPKPGMLLQAAAQLSIDLGSSIMIGDVLEDLQAGQAAGVGRRILVLTGRGKSQLAQAAGAQDLGHFEVCDSLFDAVRRITRTGDNDPKINRN